MGKLCLQNINFCCYLSTCLFFEVLPASFLLLLKFANLIKDICILISISSEIEHFSIVLIYISAQIICLLSFDVFKFYYICLNRNPLFFIYTTRIKIQVDKYFHSVSKIDWLFKSLFFGSEEYYQFFFSSSPEVLQVLFLPFNNSHWDVPTNNFTARPLWLPTSSNATENSRCQMHSFQIQMTVR